MGDKKLKDKDAKYINAEHNAGVGAVKKGLVHFLNCGRRLIKKKAELPYGEWMSWCEANLEFHRSQVNRYMLFAERVNRCLPTVGNLIDDLDAVEEIWAGTRSRSSRPEEERSNYLGHLYDPTWRGEGIGSTMERLNRLFPPDIVRRLVVYARTGREVEDAEKILAHYADSRLTDYIRHLIDGLYPGESPLGARERVGFTEALAWEINDRITAAILRRAGMSSDEVWAPPPRPPAIGPEGLRAAGD